MDTRASVARRTSGSAPKWMARNPWKLMPPPKQSSEAWEISCRRQSGPPFLHSTIQRSLPVFGRPTYDGVIAGKVSGRKWKQTRTQRASASHISRRGTSLEFRIKEKELKRAFKQRKDELKEEIRKNKEDKRKRREEREKKKEENILRSGTKFQKITNPKTLKKIAKSKQRKLLKLVPDELLSNRKSNAKREMELE
ncbi:hypothetical protein KSP40_PGU011182 [Platanthera guangdongensis]|uniref:Coiled-coil domain-containing protein 86 n=1 Tax=Platanthera guangdongensis TaxID=2320717 RepID=A0ABR2MDL6_9ASPA